MQFSITSSDVSEVYSDTQSDDSDLDISDSALFRIKTVYIFLIVYLDRLRLVDI